jgi:hypothetical protein
MVTSMTVDIDRTGSGFGATAERYCKEKGPLSFKELQRILEECGATKKDIEAVKKLLKAQVLGDLEGALKLE